MKACYTECVMVQQDENPIYGAARIIIRVEDQAGGPYLVIRGDNNEPQYDETPHDFFLHSEEEIDQFAEVCKSMLRQAKAADGEKTHTTGGNMVGGGDASQQDKCGIQEA